MADGPAQGITAGVPGFQGKLNLATASGQAGTEFGELDEVDISVSKETLDSTSRQSGGWKSSKPSFMSWTATVRGLHLGKDVTQKAMRDALSADTLLYLTHYPEGIGEGLTQQTGACWVKDWKFTGSMKDMAKAEFTLEGTGPLTESVQPTVP
jgi:predicted secreted protein